MGRILSTTAVCTVLAATAIIAVPTSTAHQDIAEMTGTGTQTESRWLSRLERVSTGSDIEMLGEDKAAISASPVIASTVLGVRTVNHLHVLDRQAELNRDVPVKTAGVVKGDRVFAPTPAQAATVKLASVSSAYTAPATAKIAATLRTESDNLTKALKQARTRIAEAAEPKSIMPKAAMASARIAARQMAQADVVQDAGTPVDAVVTAYAPDVQAKTNSAFDAVLRPGLSKAAKAKKAATPIVKAAVESAKTPVRSLIRLAKGDHKWAANPLPKASFSHKQRKCLATGIYFEARGEPTKGQKAVAQVIINRVKNPAYPNSICGVVYQNKHKRNACQFSFACDGIRDTVKSRKHWKKSVKVANDAIDGRFWMKSIGSSSHYHADYVWPRWRKKMRKMTKIGRHIFYRTYGGGWS